MEETKFKFALRNKSASLTLSHGLVGKDMERQEIVICNVPLVVKPRAILLDRLGIWDLMRTRKGRHFLIPATKEQMDEMQVPEVAREGVGFRNPAHMFEDVTAEYTAMLRENLVDELGAHQAQKDLKEKAAEADRLKAENEILAADAKRLAAEKESVLQEIATLRATHASEAIKRQK